MKILFLARHFSYLRLFESAIAELAERGHTIHLSADREESLGGAGDGRAARRAVPEGHRRLDAGAARSGAWADLGRKLRLGIDYLRFLDPRYDHAPRLRGRSEERTPKVVRWLATLPVLRDARRTPRARVGAAAVRAGGAPQPRARGVLPGAGARRRADHAARRSRLAAARSLPERARARPAHGAVRRQLGSPVEQVAAARDPGSRHGLERHAEAGSDRAAPGAARSDRRHRRAVLRPVVRPAARRARARSSASRSGSTRRGRSSCMSARRCSRTRRTRRASSNAGSSTCAAARIPCCVRPACSSGRIPGGSTSGSRST